MATKSITPQTRNVTAAFRAATDTDRADGLSWYNRARELAEELDPTNVERAAAVIAVLSPRLPWDKNAELARLAYETARLFGLNDVDIDPRYANTPDTLVSFLPCLRGNARKAFCILAGELPDDVVSGPKVRAFWHQIAHPDSALAVVVDRHAIDVALGRVTDDATRGKVLGRKGAYDDVATCYVRAAKILAAEFDIPNLTPSQVQAVTWVYWRRTRAGRKGAQGTLELAGQ